MKRKIFLICITLGLVVIQSTNVFAQVTCPPDVSTLKFNISSNTYPNVLTKGRVNILSGEGLIQEQESYFDLAGMKLRLTPNGDVSYTVELLSGVLDQDSGSEVNYGSVNLFNSAGSRLFTLPFTFPFVGKDWDEVYVNLNGNISFGESEAASWSSRNPWPDGTMNSVASEINQRSINGSEKVISALWAIYSSRSSESTVYVNSSTESFLVTWQVTRATHFNAFYAPLGLNLFQAKLYPSGVIELTYDEVDELDGIVGVFIGKDANGNNQGAVDFSSFTGNFFGSAFEVFHYPVVSKVRSESVNFVYQHFPATDDFAVVFTDFRIDDIYNHGGASGPINTSIKGIGSSPANPRDGSAYGSDRLQTSVSILYIGGLRFAETITVGSIDYYGYAFALGWLSHEIGHRWGAYLRFRNSVTGVIENLTDESCFCHWNEGLHTESFHQVSQEYTATPYTERSTMAGNFWQDNQNGTFTKIRMPLNTGPSGFSALDLYVMGLIPPEEVPETFILRDMVDLGNNLFSATKIPVRIEDVIDAEGVRVPSSETSQKEFTRNVYLIHDPGRGPDADMLERAQGISGGIDNLFALATGNRMTINRLSAPMPLLPPNHSAGVSTNPTLVWNTSSGAVSYHLQLSTDSTFSTILVEQTEITSTAFRIDSLSNQTFYFWRINASNNFETSDWSAVWGFTTESPTSVEQISGDIPIEFRLGQNYPNPFNPTTTIQFDLRKSGFVTLKVYNVLGKEVATLVSGNLRPGKYKAHLDADNFASGIYLYRLESSSFVQSKKMLLVQ